MTETIDKAALEDLGIVQDLAKQLDALSGSKTRVWTNGGTVNNLQIKLPNGKVKGYSMADTDAAMEFLSDAVDKMEGIVAC